MFPHIVASLAVVCMVCNLSQGVTTVSRHCTGVGLVGCCLAEISQGILICTNVGCCLDNKQQPLPPLSSLKASFLLK